MHIFSVKHAVLILPDRSAAIIIQSQVPISTAGLQQQEKLSGVQLKDETYLLVIPAVNTTTKHVDEIVGHLLDNTDL